MTLIIEPLADEYVVPVGGEAIVTLDDGDLHSIDVLDEDVVIWDKGSFTTNVIIADEITL